MPEIQFPTSQAQKRLGDLKRIVVRINYSVQVSGKVSVPNKYSPKLPCK